MIYFFKASEWHSLGCFLLKNDTFCYTSCLDFLRNMYYDTVSGEIESDISLKKDGDEFICGSGKHSFRIDTTSGNLTILENK